jgi:hypothetical protein
MKMSDTGPTLGKRADALLALRNKRFAMQRRVDALKAQEELAQHALLNDLRRANLTAVRGKRATVSITHVTQFSVTDWDKTLDYIRRTRGWDLLHRRVSQDACRARADQGKDVPGVDVIELAKLYINKVGG